MAEFTRTLGGGGGKSSNAGADFCLSFQNRLVRDRLDLTDRVSLEYIEVLDESGGSGSTTGGDGVAEGPAENGGVGP